MEQFSQSAREGFSLVIPAFNEASGIQQAIHEADEALRALARPYEILIVDDGSQDDTACVVAECATKLPALRLLRHSCNRGYGAALRTGFEAARHQLVGFTDADCQFHLADLAVLLACSDEYSVVVGYRMGRQDPVRRRFLSWGYNTLVRLLLGTGVRDCDCALKVFRREALVQLLPESANFFVNTEMLARARRLRLSLTEVGVRHRPRRHGHSKVSLAEVPKTLSVLLPFWWTHVVTRRPAALAALPALHADAT